MSGAIRTFFHISQNLDAKSGVGNAFSASNNHKHEMHSNEVSWLAKAPFGSRVDGIVVRVSNIAGSATAISVRLCLDSAGNFTVVPDVQATIATGIGSAALGTVAFKVDMPVFQNTSGETDALYLFFKTDTGTVTVEETRVTWSET